MNYLSVLISLFVLIVSAYCSFTIPITETGIPFTLQSLVVFVIAGLLKPKQVVLAIFVYLLLGSIGLPVFADGTSGFSKIIGSSGGFLYGFLFSGMCISFLSYKREKLSVFHWGAIMLLSTIILFIFGLGHLSFKFGFENAIKYGLVPFWKMALIKAALSALIVFAIRNYGTSVKKIEA